MILEYDNSLKSIEILERALCEVREANVIKNPVSAYQIAMRMIGNKTQEHMVVLFLNGAHIVTGKKIVSIGTMNRTIVHPREIFREAIKRNAAGIIMAHNHPSGSTAPSGEDREVTKRIRDAGEIIGIELLDHLIISRSGFYSIREEEPAVLRG